MLLRCKASHPTYGRCVYARWHDGFHEDETGLHPWVQDGKPCKWCGRNHTPDECVDLANQKLKVLTRFTAKVSLQASKKEVI